MAVNMKRRFDADDSSQEPERKRSAQACLPCRKKKMRCDGNKPTCAHCAKLGLECGYNQNRKPGLQPGYVAQLQNRIVELEALLEQQNQPLQTRVIPKRRESFYDDRRPSISSVHSITLPPIQTASPYAYPPPPPCTSSPPRRKSYDEMNAPIMVPARRHNTTPLDHLAEAAATSPPATAGKRSPTSSSEVDPNLTLPPISFPTFPHDIFNSGGGGAPVLATPSRESEIEWPISAREGGGADAEGLPPKEIVDIIIDIYFEHVHPLFPILNEGAFRSSRRSDALVSAIITICGPYFRLDPRLDRQSSKLVFQYSSNPAFHAKIIERALDQFSLPSILALTILALSYFGSGRVERLCAVMAILARYAYVYIHDPRRSGGEERKRCVSIIFLLDRCLALLTGWPLSLSEQDIDLFIRQENPRKSPSSSETNICSHWLVCAGMLGRVIECTRAPERMMRHGQTLARDIEEWSRNLHNDLRTKREYSIFQVLSNTGTILLHESLASISCEGGPVDANRRAEDASRTIAHILQAEAPRQINPLSPLSASIALRCLTNSSISGCAETAYLNDALASMRNQFPIADHLLTATRSMNSNERTFKAIIPVHPVFM